MYKLAYLVSLFFFLSCSMIFSALPPLFEDIAEIKAILEDNKLGQFLQSGESIQVIRKVEKGYVIKTNHHKLFAEVIYRPNTKPGPALFEIEFNLLVPLSP